MTIDLAKAALLVVDVQNGFITADSAPVVPVIAELTQRWAESGRPIVLTRYLNYPGSPYERLIGWRALYEAPDTDLVNELLPYTNHPRTQVLDKTVYTALTPEGIEMLRDQDVTDLVICGIATDACVLKTALDAFELDLTPWVVRDAVASNATRHPAREIHESALLLISRLVGARQLITAEDVKAVLAQTQPA